MNASPALDRQLPVPTTFPPGKGGGIDAFTTTCAFATCGTCSESMMNVLDRAFGHPMQVEEHGVMPLAGAGGPPRRGAAERVIVRWSVRPDPTPSAGVSW